MDPVLDSVPSRGTGIATAPVRTTASPSSTLKPLWAAIGVLGVAVVALGGTLVYQHGRDSGAAAASAPMASAPLQPAAGGAVVTAPASLAAREEIVEQKTAVAPAAPVTAAPKIVAQAPRPVVPAPVRAPASYAHGPAGYADGYSGSYGTAQPVAQAAAPVCAVCGRVESVNAVSRPVPASGVGAVAGGVLGAVVGNQVGHGSGRTVATLLGAAGGGYLGHTIEQRTRSTTAYVVNVRMDDGSRRTFERAQPVPVGERVTVEGGGFRLGQGAAYSTEPAYRQVSQPQGRYATSGY